jgi:hypothetical protein
VRGVFAVQCAYVIDVHLNTYSDSQIQAQMRVLNEDYASVGISWNLASVDRTTNPAWFNTAFPNTLTESAMKRALRKGGAGDLNIYTTR